MTAVRGVDRLAYAKLRPLGARILIWGTALMTCFRGLALIAVVAAGFCGPESYAQQAQTSPRPVSVADVFALRDLHDPQMSPEGQWVAYAMGTVNREEDKNEERIWMVPAAGGGGRAADNPEFSFAAAPPHGAREDP